MGGAINLVTRTPTKRLEAEGSIWTGGRSDAEGWNGYAMIGTRQPKYYIQGSANYSDRNYWSLSGDYDPTTNSLQPAGRRQSSDTSDSRYNVKAGWTPNATDEYTINYINQQGEKGAPLNVFNNPPVPANGYWRWPFWDIQNTSFLTKTQLGQASYVKTKIYYNTFENGLDAFDDITLHDAVAQRPLLQPLRRPCLRRQHRGGHHAAPGQHVEVRRALPHRRAHRAELQPADASDAELPSIRNRNARSTRGRSVSKIPSV